MSGRKHHVRRPVREVPHALDLVSGLQLSLILLRDERALDRVDELLLGDPRGELAQVFGHVGGREVDYGSRCAVF